MKERDRLNQRAQCVYELECIASARFVRADTLKKTYLKIFILLFCLEIFFGLIPPRSLCPLWLISPLTVRWLLKNPPTSFELYPVHLGEPQIVVQPSTPWQP